VQCRPVDFGFRNGHFQILWRKKATNIRINESGFGCD
jgi:hypothetical protein